MVRSITVVLALLVVLVISSTEAPAEAARPTKAECEAEIPADPAPQPNKHVLAGVWKCVFTGARLGERRVDLVQNLGGTYTAKLTASLDDPASWDGSIVGDRVSFRFKGEKSGGWLTIAAGDETLKGVGREWSSGSGCMKYGVECGRQKGMKAQR